MTDMLTIDRSAEAASGVVVWRLAGQLDGRGGQQLMSACAGALQSGTSLVLSCQRVEFISSSGIGVLLALSEDFRDRDLRLRIASPSAEVRMAISLLNLEDYLHIDDSEAQSLERLAA